MFKEQMNKLKSLMIKKKEENNNLNKKKIENLVFFLIVLIITLISINSILKHEDTESEDVNSPYKVLAENENSNIRKWK